MSGSENEVTPTRLTMTALSPMFCAGLLTFVRKLTQGSGELESSVPVCETGSEQFRPAMSRDEAFFSLFQVSGLNQPI